MSCDEEGRKEEVMKVELLFGFMGAET